MRPGLLLGVTSLLLFGCAEEAQLELQVCGELIAPIEVDSLRVSALDEARAEERFAAVLELGVCAIETSSQLPVSLSLEPAAEPQWVVVQGLHDGVEVIRAEGRVSPASQLSELALNLVRGCLGVSCSLGQTCMNGACVVTPWHDEAGITCSGGPTTLPSWWGQEPEEPTDDEPRGDLWPDDPADYEPDEALQQLLDDPCAEAK